MNAKAAAPIRHGPCSSLSRLNTWTDPVNHFDPWSEPQFVKPSHRRPPAPRPGEPTLQQRLDRVNAHFRFNAAQVFCDEDALRLLAMLYEQGGIDLQDIDLTRFALPLAKLTAANFAVLHLASVSVTEPGQAFVNRLLEI